MAALSLVPASCVVALNGLLVFLFALHSYIIMEAVFASGPCGAFCVSLLAFISLAAVGELGFYLAICLIALLDLTPPPPSSTGSSGWII